MPTGVSREPHCYAGACLEPELWGGRVARYAPELHCLIMPHASSLGKISCDKPLSWVKCSKDIGEARGGMKGI